MTEPRCRAPQRFLALGASNLARMALPLVDAKRARTGGPVEAWLALGRGRSFGITSSLLGRRLPGIDGCGLWRALESAPPLPTTAVVMDVGNDLLYGIDVQRILGWVDAALRRLAAHAEHRIVVGLPLAGLRTLPAWRFALVRTVLVPSCRLSLAAALTGACRLHDGLAALARTHGALFREPRSDWYGFDPIHVKRRHWRDAACDWLGVQGTPPAPEPRVDGALARLRFLGAAPAERAWFGTRRTCAQPVRRFRDGTSPSLW